MSDWTEKYRPETLTQVIGNESSVKELKQWASNWKPGTEPVILYGRPGLGKTTAAHAIGNEFGWETIEMNASDERTGDIIDDIAGQASQTGTLTMTGTGGRRLIILDEADNLHGNADRGGKKAITRIVKETKQPIVLIANDLYGMTSTLRNNCKTIEFTPVETDNIVNLLDWICKEENISYDSDALERIAKKSDGDVRTAVNDLQSVTSKNKRLTVDDLTTSEKNKEIEIFDFLDDALKQDSAQEVNQKSMQVDETPDDLLMWIEENIVRVYDGEELASAYENLGRASEWLGRVLATQEYSYWKYASDNMTAGVAASRDSDKGGWTRFAAPYGRYYSSSTTVENIAEKIAHVDNVSISTAKKEIIPLLSSMIPYCKPREMAVTITARYDFDESELAEITGSGKTTNKVQSIVEDAKETKTDFDPSNYQQETTQIQGTDETDDEIDDTGGREDDTDDSSKDESTDGSDNNDEDSDDKTQQSGLGDFV